MVVSIVVVILFKMVVIADGVSRIGDSDSWFWEWWCW